MSAQALANAVSMDEAFFRAVVQKLYEVVTKEGDDARTAMAKQLMSTWGAKNYDENALQFVMLSPTHASTVEERLKNEKIGYMTFNDNYGNKCFIVNDENKDRLNDIIMSTIGFDPKYNKELTAEKFLEYAHDNKTEDVISIKFKDEKEMIDFKNKCYAGRNGFVVADYVDKNDNYVVLALAKDLKTDKAGVDFITALASKSISDIQKGSMANDLNSAQLKLLKDAAIDYDATTVKTALNNITNGENFVIGNERSNNSPYIEFDADKNSITIYDYNESSRSYGISQEFDLSDFDVYNAKDRAAIKATLAKYFDAVENATIYKPEEFTKHLQKDNGTLSNEYKKRRFKEYDKIFNNEIGKLSPEKLSDLQEGRPSYDTNLLKEYTDIIIAQKQYLKDKYRLNDLDLDNVINTLIVPGQLLEEIGKELPEETIEKFKNTKFIDNEGKQRDLYNTFLNTSKDNEDYTGFDKKQLPKEFVDIIKETNNDELIFKTEKINAIAELFNLNCINIDKINEIIDKSIELDCMDKDIRAELHEHFKYAVTKDEIAEELDKLISDYASKTDEKSKQKLEVFRDIKTNIEKTDIKRYDEVEIDVTKSQVQEKENEHERE